MPRMEVTLQEMFPERSDGRRKSFYAEYPQLESIKTQRFGVLKLEVQLRGDILRGDILRTQFFEGHPNVEYPVIQCSTRHPKRGKLELGFHSLKSIILK